MTSIDTSVAAVTVTDVPPDSEPRLAETVAVPVPTAVSNPVVAPVVPTDITVASVDAQLTCLVRSVVELSERVPVAVNCKATPLARLGVAGVTWIDVSTTAVTVTVVLPEILPLVAVIRAVPAPIPLATPVDRRDAGNGRCSTNST